MKTLIAYSSSHGCTEKIALKIRNISAGPVTITNLKEKTDLDLTQFDRVIIGGSIHAGYIQKNVKQFCKKHEAELENKELGLFICCMEEGEKATIQFNDAFPQNLRKNAKATACFGGEFDFEKMSTFQKIIIRKIAKVETSTSKVDYEAIHHFSKKMDKVFNPFLFLV